MDSSVKTIKDLTPQVLEAIRQMANQRVMVGVPAESAFRAPSPGETGPVPNNAEIAYINEFGEPAMRIPPRPFLIPAIEAMKPEIIKRLHKIADDAVSGRGAETVNKGLHTLGGRARDAVVLKITEGPFQKLSEYTLFKRRQRGHTGTNPLIEYGKLRKSINYAIRKIRKAL